MRCDDVIQAIQKLSLENIPKNHISKIGEGAWHDVYKVERALAADIVLRIKKKEAYGAVQDYEENALISEYESTKIYYQNANACCDGICPSFFDYFLDESIVFTVESYMGKGVPLQRLRHHDAFSVGEKLGDFFRSMHSKTTGLEGFGALQWNGEKLEGKVQQDVNQIWQDDNDQYISVLEKLTRADLQFDQINVVDKVIDIIKDRRNHQQKIALVNQDITPENMIVHSDNVSIIDPFPRLDFDLKYAGYVVFCYKFLLPAYSTAPRYRSSGYLQNASTMRYIGDGFIKGYTSGDTWLIRSIKYEYILWVLLETYEHYEILNGNDLNYKIRQQMGDKDMINNRLSICLDELEKSCLAL
ncbi:hypothetical protein KGF86_03035 [Ornithinibacillus massiliensis]|uniref:Aminoglycoside phosphotransferase domain-containing protein n=1 Tax=Ornithinibacillus massiliensis TaxID=1944633 RepID=A0ABS5MA34_9BACI|nr:hypothetical protein [Ornithinibacillus massiliensis]MBS3679181.1 hypothetical protein [Ornithinibacillus massiliensis]